MSAEAFVERRRTSFVGMAFVLGSLAMLFASFFFSYAVVRFHAPAWPPAGTPPIPRGLPATATALLVLSSVLLAARGARPVRAMLAAIGLGLAFLAIQAASWASLWRSGFTTESGVAASVHYALTLVVGLHVFAAVAALAAAGRERLRFTAMLWHFVVGMATLTFVGLQLL